MRDDEFEWDDRKAKRNERQHGVPFKLARLVFDDPNAIAIGSISMKLTSRGN